MNKKAVVYNLIGNVLVYLCTLLVNFILSPYIVEMLGVEAYGYVQLANNFIGYISIVTIALTSMAGRFVSIELFKKDYEKANIYFNSVFYATLVLTAVLGTLSILLITLLDKFLIIPGKLVWDVKIMFFMVFAAFYCGLILTVYSVGLFVENKIYIRAKRNIESAIIRAVLLLGVYYLFRARLYYLGVLNLFVNLYVSLWNVHYTHKYLPNLQISRKYLKKNAILEIISSGVWNSISQLSSVLNEGLDLIITNLFIGATEMGILSIAKMIPNTLMALLSNLGEPFMPKMTEAYAKGESKAIKEIFNYGSKVIGFVMSIPISGFIVLGDVFFKLWQPTQDKHLLHMLAIISILNLILSCSTSIIYGVFTVANKIKLNSIIGISVGFLNCGLVFVLLKHTDLGIFAVAGVSVCTAIIRNLVFTFPYGARCAGLKWYEFYGAAFRTVCSVLCMTLFFLMLKYLYTPNSWFDFSIIALICAVIGAFVNWWLLFNRDDRMSFLNGVKEKI